MFTNTDTKTDDPLFKINNELSKQKLINCALISEYNRIIKENKKLKAELLDKKNSAIKVFNMIVNEKYF